MQTKAGRQLIHLPDGRRLSWFEYGDAKGVPALYVPGTPSSGLAGGVYDDAARRAGVRWISVDKPGYGGSDRHRGADLTQRAAALSALVDHLGLPSFVAVGESGGGPLALALALPQPARVGIVVLLSSMGAYDRQARRGMKADNRLLMRVASTAPALLHLPLGRMGRQLNDPVRAASLAKKHASAASGEERDLLANHPDLLPTGLAAAAEALRDGPGGAIDELRLLSGPWGFDLAQVRVPVHLWHGTADRHVPVHVARRTAKALPNGVLHLVERGGHSAGLQRIDDVMACIVTEA